MTNESNGKHTHTHAIIRECGRGAGWVEHSLMRVQSTTYKTRPLGFWAPLYTEFTEGKTTWSEEHLQAQARRASPQDSSSIHYQSPGTQAIYYSPLSDCLTARRIIVLSRLFSFKKYTTYTIRVCLCFGAVVYAWTGRDNVIIDGESCWRGGGILYTSHI